jgi:hypothetical protein
MKRKSSAPEGNDERLMKRQKKSAEKVPLKAKSHAGSRLRVNIGKARKDTKQKIEERLRE